MPCTRLTVNHGIRYSQLSNLMVQEGEFATFVFYNGSHAVQCFMQIFPDLFHTPCTIFRLTLSAVFCPFTHTQTRASLAREWLEDEWSGINGSVSRVQHWYSLPTQPLLTGVILENVKMSSERYCFSELEKIISLEMLALHKIFWNVKKRFLKSSIN